MENKTYAKKIRHLKYEIEKLRDALGFYSMDCNYKEIGGWLSQVQSDRGDIAKKVLKSISKNI